MVGYLMLPASPVWRIKCPICAMTRLAGLPDFRKNQTFCSLHPSQVLLLFGPNFMHCMSEGILIPFLPLCLLREVGCSTAACYEGILLLINKLKSSLTIQPQGFLETYSSGACVLEAGIN